MELWIDGLEEQYREADGDAENVTPLREIVSSSELVAALIAFARMGGRLAEAQLRDDMSGTQRARFDEAVEAWAEDRIDSLLEDGAEEQSSLYYPLSPQPLDSFSSTQIAAGAVVGVASIRGVMVAQNEAETAHSFGHYRGADALGASTKTWGRTSSQNERPEHLATVGETVALNQLFSNGNFWGGEEIGCKCPITVRR